MVVVVVVVVVVVLESVRKMRLALANAIVVRAVIQHHRHVITGSGEG